jgi:hypothetical protein
MAELMYTKDYDDDDDDAEERGSECVSESENAGVGTLSQGKGYTSVRWLENEPLGFEVTGSARARIGRLKATVSLLDSNVARMLLLEL